MKRPLKTIRNALFAALHTGTDRYCLYCGKSFSKFLHAGVRSKVLSERRVVGGGYRLNCRCPSCGSSERSRLLYLYLMERTDVFLRKTRLLHVSPEMNLAAVLASASSIEYVCGALEPDEFAPLKALRVDVCDIPFQDGHFDAVICNHVLEHVRDDTAGMREIFRVLAPGGWAILQVPIALNLPLTDEDPSVTVPRERKRRFGQSDHLRLYGADYAARLESAGFRVAMSNPFKERWTPDIERHGLNPEENVMIGSKPFSGDHGSEGSPRA